MTVQRPEPIIHSRKGWETESHRHKEVSSYGYLEACRRLSGVCFQKSSRKTVFIGGNEKAIY